MEEVPGPVSQVGLLRGWRETLSILEPVDDADRVDQLRELEALRSAVAAVQARITVDLDRSQCQVQRDAGVPEDRVGLGVAAQVALARRESPAKGSRLVGLAHALVEELPHTFAALERGETSEWRATLVARETACLTRADRGRVDAELAARPGGLGGLGDGQTAAETRRIAYRLDPQAAVARAARAESQRRVTLRPAPDTMTQLSGLLPVRQGVAVFAALTRAADSLRSAGDSRSRGQIMADTLVERITGAATPADLPVELHVVMTDRALLAGDDTPAEVAGHGPIPAALVRHWLRDSETEAEAKVWLRRLYTSPVDGSLVAMDSGRREFLGLLRRFLIVRDRVCRTSWCGAPIRHLDHPTRHTDGGPTSVGNAQSLCEACNHAKEAPGWHARTDGSQVWTTTPTGHRYRSRSPGLETHFRNLVLTA